MIITITMPDPEVEPFEMKLQGNAYGGFLYETDAMLTPDEMLALGTALKRWETKRMKEREVTAQEHATACMDALDVKIEELS